MMTLKFADTHNMAAFLSKPAESEGFEQIEDFLNAQPIRHALTVNPIIYTSCIEQFWSTIKAKTVNDEVQLQALVDGKKIIITESTMRRDLQLEDAEGVDCVPNATIFEQLALMGPKTTAWNEFSSIMASVIICLATNQKFNFSKFIFESMVKNLDNVSKFLMYLRCKFEVSKKPPSVWHVVATMIRGQPGLDELDFDDLYNNLKVYEHELKGISNSNSQNIAFLSTEVKGSTLKQSTAEPAHIPKGILKQITSKFQLLPTTVFSLHMKSYVPLCYNKHLMPTDS
ncbi:hypothetical protein Tco_1328146 [Tanacetum coccineum]